MRYISYLLLLLTGISSCTKIEKSTEIAVTASMFENRTPGTPNKFGLSCETVKVFSCSNYRLVVNSSIDGSTVTVNIKEVQVPVSCDSGYAPARAPMVEIGNLPEGNYTLAIINGNKTTNGTISVDSTAYNITFPTGNKFVFNYTRLYKIPGNIIWGSVVYDSVRRGKMLPYLDSLARIGATAYSLTPGHYGAFTTAADGTLPLKTANATIEAKTFIYKYTGDYQKLEQLISNFKTKYADTATFNISTYDGRYFSSSL